MPRYLIKFAFFRLFMVRGAPKAVFLHAAAAVRYFGLESGTFGCASRTLLIAPTKLVLAADYVDPEFRENLESRSPNLGPYTTKGTL